MAVVMRVLPRYWDAGRFLRFLTGLALLALAFGAPVEAAAPAPPPAITAASVTESDIASEAAVRPLPPLPPLPLTVPVLLIAAVTLVLTGLAQRVAADRAPPAV